LFVQGLQQALLAQQHLAALQLQMQQQVRSVV
jgi:hypothetical protein